MYVVSSSHTDCLSHEYVISNCDTNRYISIVVEKKINPYLLQQDYEKRFCIIYEDIHSQLSNDKSLSFSDVMAAVYICLQSGKSIQAEEYMNYLCDCYGNSIKGIYYIKGIIECYNDNYGNAEQSFTQEIANSISFLRSEIEYGQITQDYISDQVVSYFLLCKATQSRACVFAVREKRDDVLKELEFLCVWRKLVQDFYFATEMFSKEIPLCQFTDITAEDYLLNQYISSDVALFYRIKNCNSSLPELSVNENLKVVLPIRGVSWWCNLIDNPDEKELFDIFIENDRSKIRYILKYSESDCFIPKAVPLNRYSSPQGVLPPQNEASNGQTDEN